MQTPKENKSCYASNKQREILIELFCLPEVQNNFFLTGGTALSVFYLFHRVSNDIDLFTTDKFDFPAFLFTLKLKWPMNFSVIKESSSFVSSIIENIVSNKLCTIVSRTEPKDFIDFYFLLKLIPGLSCDRIYKDAKQKDTIFDDAPTAAYQIEENFKFIKNNPELIPHILRDFDKNECTRFYDNFIQWIYNRIKPAN
jgi:hypothetical protein